MTEPEALTCIPKSLPEHQQVQAAVVATAHNPLNAPVVLGVMQPAKIALLTSKYWGPGTRRVSTTFTESVPTDLRTRIFTHLNAWSKTAKFSFYYTTAATAMVRISRGADGYWSYLGTDVLSIPQGLPTMNLQGFTMSTPDSEFRRVIRHEAGHTLGFPHEHMRRELVARIDPQKAYAYFARTQGWSRTDVDQQVLTALEDRQLQATPTADQTSIMCYQLPGSITRDGQPIIGGLDINAQDYAFAGRIYPGVRAV